MKKLSESDKQTIINLYEEGLNCVEIKNRMMLKGHQQVLNVLNKYEHYIPYRNGRRGPSRKYTLNEEFFKVIDTEYKAYILGFFCADGHLSLATKRVRFLLATKDKDILEKIKFCLGSNTLIRDIVVPNRFPYGEDISYHSKVEFCSAKMTKDLENYGIDNNKSYSLTSDIIKNVPEPLIRHFLRGYFDGDGNVFYGVKYSSGTKYNINIAGNLEFLKNTFGKYFPTSNKYYFNPRSKQCYMYKLSSKANVDAFLEYIYKDSNIFLDRKYEAYLKSKAVHTKQGELLGSPTTVRGDNQQPSLSSNTLEGSTTNSRLQTDNAEESNANTSALPNTN